MTVTTDSINQITQELERAIDKFPTWPNDPLHAIAVVNEEVGELNKSLLQSLYEPHKVNSEDLHMEAIQTAAMALRFLISLNNGDYDFQRCEQHAQR